MKFDKTFVSSKFAIMHLFGLVVTYFTLTIYINKMTMFRQETGHQEPCEESNNRPKQDQQGYTHQEAGATSTLPELLSHGFF